jgi:predicted nucleic acid-binding protein
LIVLDTNVVSEIGKLRPSTQVMDWLYQRPGNDLFITSITEAEIRYGISLVPAGKRRVVLQQFADQVLDRTFGARNLSFDSDAAKMYAAIASRQRLAGMTVSVPDAQIAAIAANNGFAIATRNEKHFLHSGVKIINPWLGLA